MFKFLSSTPLLLLLSTLFQSSSILIKASSGEPTISHTLFDNLPSRIFYFDDTSVVIYHDQIGKNVYRSTDEGATWNILSGVPVGQAAMVIEHPFDSKIAFVLTNSKTHYRSMDRGQSWANFETSLPPSFGSTTMSFHSSKWNWILFTASNCESLGGWKGRVCHDETFYTKDAFSSSPKSLLRYTSKCIFAHDKTTYSLSVPEELIYCVAFEPPTSSTSSSTSSNPFAELFSGMRSLKESRLYSSLDFFEKDTSFVDLGIGSKEARGVIGIGGISKFLVTALKPISSGSNEGNSNEMILYVTEDSKTWSRALFPHGEGLKESAYTIVESTPHSLLIDVDSSTSSTSGTLFTSNSNGTYFVKSLEHTNRNKNGIVDFEKLVGIEGVAVVNTVENWEEAERGGEKVLKTRITFDDGARWNLLAAPSVDNKGKKVSCDTSDSQTCSLHLHSVTQPHNFGRVFSSTAPGLVMGVGSIGPRLLPYDECDTFLSSDNGLNWKMVEDGATKYEFGDKGAVVVLVGDEEEVEEVKFSFDFGKTWKSVSLNVKLRSRLLTTIPDSTSLKFLLLGTLSRTSEDKGSKGERHIVVGIDFGTMGKRKCKEGDMERWYARSLGGGKGGKEADCLMGHKQWFLRRKQDADCIVDQEFDDPIGVEENCPCSDEDYECDYNFSPDGNECVLAGPEIIPPGACIREGDLFSGSSGFRLIPGNTCEVRTGIKKDTNVMKSCNEAVETPGLVSHSIFSFPGIVRDQSYFSDSHTLLAFTTQNKVWQSSNEGYSWNEVANGAFVVAMMIHTYSRDRAYLITDSRTVHYTTDKGSSWNIFTAPLEPNTLSIPLLDFHPLRSDWLIWTGAKDCNTLDSSTCRAVAYYTKDNGRNWYQIEEYVRICTWGRDRKLKIDEKIIFCESYRDKKGSQRNVVGNNNPMRLISGENYYGGKKITLFESIVGFATFEEYMVVASESSRAIDLMISLNAKDFALANFPPNMKLENQAYTVLQSTTDSIFLHVTTHPDEGSEWGTLFKSNSNGTYYSPSLTFANRNSLGYVDFEKMIGLDGIAVINIVSNPEEAAISRKKKLVSRITHNDGGRWKPMTPPAKDSLGQPYACTSTKCSLHIHGFTEKKDPRATYSSPSAVGLMLAVGNVGESLIPYADSDTFLTRDGGFTWEEVHKDAHQFEYGDQGSILLLVNDEDVTDHVTYSLDEGLTWADYNFGGQRIRVRSVVTVPLDTSRKFILFGAAPDKTDSSLAIHIDFTSITNKKCVLNLASPNDDDFELWSPSENREEKCLFGRQTLFHRRIRDRMCYIGERLPQPASIVRNCPCGEEDFECEFNYQRDSAGKCVLTTGASPLPSSAEDQCKSTPGQSFWYERTALRKIPHSTCTSENGLRLDQGFAHPCPGTTSSHGFLFYASFILFPFAIAGLAGLWYQRRRVGKIRLGDPGETAGGVLDVLVSIPFFVIGTIAVIVGYVKEMEIPFISDRLRRFSYRGGRGGYRGISIDDDAEILNQDLRDYEDEEE